MSPPGCIGYDSGRESGVVPQIDKDELWQFICYSGETLTEKESGSTATWQRKNRETLWLVQLRSGNMPG